MKRSAIKARSKKQARTNEVRADLVRTWLQESADAPGNYLGTPLCEIGWDRACSGIATHGHEPLTRKRSGQRENILLREQVLLTCLHCHDMAHANPAEAEARGFLRASST